jgi:hypothetical protein
MVTEPPVTSVTGSASEGVSHRGLATAVRPHNDVHVTTVDNEVETANDLAITDGDSEVFND